MHVGHDAALVDGVDTLVVSSAVRESNPELARARERGLRVLHRSRGARRAHGRPGRGRGRRRARQDDDVGDDRDRAARTRAPTRRSRSAAPCSPPTDRSAAAATAPGGAFVAEADESDGSFLAYAPLVAVVTNVEPDHLDHYGSAEAFEDAFVAFAERIRPGGTLVACADDAGAVRLVDRARAQLAARDVAVVTYGTSPTADVVVGDLRPDGAALERRPDDARRRADRPARRARARTTRSTPAAPGRPRAGSASTRSPPRPASAAFRGTGRRFEDRGTVGRRARRRRLRAPPDRGRGAAAAGALGRRATGA